MKRSTLFLDRDGTLVYPIHYPSCPEELRIYAGLGPALHNLQGLGFLLVLVTNQSGVARGYFTEADLDRMHAYLRDELREMDVRLDGVYYCPHHPEGIIPELAIACECRKPRPGLLLQAALELDIDLAHSWMVGDILDDVEAGNLAGCHTVLVDLDTEPPPDSPLRLPTFVARNTLHALNIIQASETMQPSIELSYQPLAWQKAARKDKKQIAGVFYD